MTGPRREEIPLEDYALSACLALQMTKRDGIQWAKAMHFIASEGDRRAALAYSRGYQAGIRKQKKEMS
jgi:hypothetical protein